MQNNNVGKLIVAESWVDLESAKARVTTRFVFQHPNGRRSVIASRRERHAQTIEFRSGARDVMIFNGGQYWPKVEIEDARAVYQMAIDTGIPVRWIAPE